ncbi:MAG: Adaptor for signal transduction [Heterodermia speciosa]|uniref:Adaptor for signal transduction n=1 Tax=Heterodermia speciosa TaxID=116794 RepID=A0A8H3EEW8_9LECA|nr:MAG: Adaptor for signal transduction [Heterodermia speciosa]
MAGHSAYQADSDADDEYERSVMTSPMLPTDDDTSPTESDPPSTEPTPTFGRQDTDKLSPGDSILKWTAGQCADYVSTLGLPQYCDTFLENEIVGEALIALKHEELKEMSIVSVGHRLTILKGVYDVKIRQDVPIESDHYMPPSADASLHDQTASREDVSRIIQSIKLRDDRLVQMEAEIRRVTDEYRKLRDELLPIFRMAKDRSQPLPFPSNSPDLQQHHEDVMSPLQSQLPPEKGGSSLSRKFSTKRLFLGSTPKSSSPTHIPQSIPEGKTMNDNSTLDPSAAALAASSHLTASINGDVQPATSPNRANIPSPTSPNTYVSNPPTILPHRAYGREAQTPSTARPNIYPHDEPLTREVYNSGPSERSGPTPTPGSMARPTRNPPREISTATTNDPSDPSSAPNSGGSSSRNDNPSVNIFKSFRVSMEDPCYKVLPAALKKYNINADWRQYALYIVYGDQERCLGLEEKPLILFKQLDREGRKPMFMLRKHAAPMEGHSGPSGMGAGGGGTGFLGASDTASLNSVRGHGSQIQFPPGGVL